MGRKRVLVLGWYGHGNLGDEAFKTSFQELWPQADFTFVDKVPADTSSFDALWVGGGSFLDQPLPGLTRVKLPLGFIGVGIGDYVHPDNAAMLNKAKLIITRDNMSGFTPVGDLVFGRKFHHKRVPGKRVVILLNDHFSPRSKSAEWQTMGYYWFQQEFAQVCDRLIEEDHHLDFLPMCSSSGIDDRRMAAPIHGRLKKPWHAVWSCEEPYEERLLEKISKAHLVITQRFHGAVFSCMLGTPFIFINSHDKMSALAADLSWDGIVDFYGFTCRKFWDAYENVGDPSLLLDYSKTIGDRWKRISGIVADKFF